MGAHEPTIRQLARVEEEAAAYATARKEFLASKTRSDKGSKSKK